MTSALDRIFELIDDAKVERDSLQGSHETLIAIARAKRSGRADPAAWARAFEILDVEEAAEAHDSITHEPFRCPDCQQVLLNPERIGHIEIPPRPRCVVCGPMHERVYDDFVVYDVGDGELRLRYERRTLEPNAVFGESNG